MGFLEGIIADITSPQGKQAAAAAGLAGGIDYLINGGNAHAVGVAGVVYSGIRLAEPYLARILERYKREEDV